jgi:hypothetical protein
MHNLSFALPSGLLVRRQAFRRKPLSFNCVVFEYLDGSRHLTELIAARRARDGYGGITVSEPPHHFGNCGDGTRYASNDDGYSAESRENGDKEQPKVNEEVLAGLIELPENMPVRGSKGAVGDVSEPIQGRI